MADDIDVACARALGLDPDANELHAIEQYSVYPESAKLLEDEIERRGLQDDYMRELLSIVIPGGGSVLAFWKILRATPEQRARAFLKAVT